MADTKISGESPVVPSAVVDTDSLPGVFGNANGRITWASLKSALLSGLSAFTSTAKGLVPASGGGTANFLRADGSWAAPSGGGGGSSPARGVGYVSGRFYPQGRFGRGTLTVTANVIYALPLQIDTDTTITALEFRISGTAVAGALGVAGVYANASGAPGALLAQGAAPADMATSPSNAKTTFSTPLALTAGLYWIVTNFNAAPTVTSIIASDPQANALIGAPDNANAAQTYVGMVGTASFAYTGSLPATAPAMAPSTTAPPLMFFGVQ